MLDWISDNLEWLFSGVGVVVLVTVARRFWRARRGGAGNAHGPSLSVGHGNAVQVGRDLHVGGSIGMPGGSATPATESERSALQEIVGKLAPAVSTIMNAAASPRNLAALREEMRVRHERLDELSALFVNEPDTEKAIRMLGQAGGAAVSMSPNVRMELFEMYNNSLGVVRDALNRRSN